MKLTPIVFSIAAATGAFAHVLWDASIKGLLLLLLVLAVVLLFRGISAALRHLILVAAVAALVLIPILSWTLPAWRILPVPTAPIPLAQVGSTAAGVSLPTPLAANDSASNVASFPMASSDSSPAVAASVPALAESMAPWATPHIFLAAWIAGSLLLMMRLAASRLRLCELEDTANLARDEQLLEHVRHLKQRLDLDRPVEILIGDEEAMPMTWGLFRAQLLLPSSYASWSRSKLESVILHELAHVKRKDVATQLLVQLISAVFWFNPAVWLAAWRIRVERERACDDLVLSAGVTAPDYAENLLGIVSGCEIRPQLRGTAIAMADKVRIEGRLKTILNDQLNRGPATKRSSIFAVVALAIAIAPLAMLQADDDEKDVLPTADSSIGATTVGAELPEPLAPEPEDLPLPADLPSEVDVFEPAGATERHELFPIEESSQTDDDRESLRSAPPVSFQFSKARLSDVFRFLFDEAKVPYILPEGSIPQDILTTFNLTVSPFSALEKIAHSHGYRVEKVDDTWTVRKSTAAKEGLVSSLFNDTGDGDRTVKVDAVDEFDDLFGEADTVGGLDSPESTEPIVTRFIQLRHADADEAQKTIKEFPGLIGGSPNQLVSDTRTNRLLVTGTKRFINKVEALVKIVDSPPKKEDRSNVYREWLEKVPWEKRGSTPDLPKLGSLFQRLAEVEKVYTDKHPKVQSLRSQIQELSPGTAWKRQSTTSPELGFDWQTTSQSAGIGCVLHAQDNSSGGSRIAKVIDSSPAQTAGLKEGDRIIGIAQDHDGPLIDVRKMPVAQVVGMCRGTKGTKLRLLIIPTGAEDGIRKEIVITRDIISAMNNMDTHRNLRVEGSWESSSEVPHDISTFGEQSTPPKNSVFSSQVRQPAAIIRTESIDEPRATAHRTTVGVRHTSSVTTRD